MTRRSRLRRRPALLALIVCLAAAGPMRLARAQGGAGVAVVVHPDVPIDNLTGAELRRLVLGDREFWPAGVRITLLLRAPVAHERDVVLKNLCDMSEAQFRQHWIGKVFRADTAAAPKIGYSSELAVAIVNRLQGAISDV